MQNLYYNLRRWQVILLCAVFALSLWSVYSNKYADNLDLPKSVRISIPEGYTNAEIAELFDERFVYFNKKEFINNAPQGRMFPDTYYVGLYLTALQFVDILERTFDNKITPFVEEIESSGHPLEDIIMMASILEAEVRSDEDMRKVSDILWKRLDINMALQVDSAMETYERPGFHDLPLGNPGLRSILSALRPTPTEYWYFLTDKAGTVYYGEDFEEHKVNRA